MMTPSELKGWQKKCEARVEECFVIAEKHFNREIPRPRITWSTQQKKTAGTARSSWGGVPVEIKLSLQILSLNGEEFCARTPGHEAAHLIQAYIDGRSDGHGYRWKQVMRLLGQEASRCHSMKTMASLENKKDFVCGCKDFVHSIGIGRKKTLQGISWGRVTCKMCKQKLVAAPTQSAAKLTDDMMMARAAKAAVKAVASGKPIKTAKIPAAPKLPTKKKVVISAVVPKKTRSFADQVREVLDANPTKSYEQIVQLLVKIEPNVSKCRCYARDFMIKRGTYR